MESVDVDAKVDGTAVFTMAYSFLYSICCQKIFWQFYDSVII